MPTGDPPSEAVPSTPPGEQRDPIVIGLRAMSSSETIDRLLRLDTVGAGTRDDG